MTRVHGCKQVSKEIHVITPNSQSQTSILRSQISRCEKTRRFGVLCSDGYLLLVLPVRRIQGLHQVGCMAKKHGVAGGPHHHTDHGEPHVTHALWRVGTVSNAQHVAHCHEEGVRVLYVPGCILRRNWTRGFVLLRQLERFLFFCSLSRYKHIILLLFFF